MQGSLSLVLPCNYNLIQLEEMLPSFGNTHVPEGSREGSRARAPVVLVAHARSHGKRFPTPTLHLGIRILKHKLALQPIAHVIHLRPYD